MFHTGKIPTESILTSQVKIIASERDPDLGPATREARLLLLGEERSWGPDLATRVKRLLYLEEEEGLDPGRSLSSPRTQSLKEESDPNIGAGMRVSSLPLFAEERVLEPAM